MYGFVIESCTCSNRALAAQCQSPAEGSGQAGAGGHHHIRGIPALLPGTVCVPHQWSPRLVRRTPIYLPTYLPNFLAHITHTYIYTYSCAGGAMLAWLAPPIILSQETMVRESVYICMYVYVCIHTIKWS